MADDDFPPTPGVLRVTVRPIPQTNVPSGGWKVAGEQPLTIGPTPSSQGEWGVTDVQPLAPPVNARPPQPGPAAATPWGVQSVEPVQEQPEQSRGIVERTIGGIKHGFGERELGVSAEERAKYPGWQMLQPVIAPADALMRSVPATIGGVAGLGAGAFEALGGSQSSADRVQRDVTGAGEMALMAAGLRYGKAPRVAKELLAPEIVSPQAADAAALIRQETGKAARSTEQTTFAVEPWQKPVSQLSLADQLGIMHHIEGTGPAPATPSLRALADTLRDAFEQRKTKLQALPQHAQMQFVEDYFPHFWTDPAAAANAVRGGFGKQGSGASLKARTVPTIQEGINQGLTPLTTNPIEATLRYINSMDKFIASQEIRNAAEANGTIVYVRPKAMGASGHPQSSNVPPGYTALKGRGSDTPQGKAYAPEDWARVYNNFISRGFEDIGGGEFGTVYNALRNASNFATQLKLSLSGYHAFTMAEATMSNQMAKAVGAIRHLEPKEAAYEFGKTYVAPVTYATKGKELKEVYLGKTKGTPEQRQIVDLITEAGGRMASAKHALAFDYGSSALGSYVKAFRRGRLRMEMLAAGQDFRSGPLGAARQAAIGLGRAMDTFNQPLFEHYIPAIKNAAAAENVGQWLKQNPMATHAEQLAATRKIVDSIDNRFGEMIHDNIFWHKMAKQSVMLAMLSYSWNMGGIREVGGGIRDIAQVGKKPWTSKADYVVGMTLNWAIMSAIYQTLKTGQPPEDLRDLAAPRTGGVDSRSGQPERIIVPGIMKDVFGYYEKGPLGELSNKLSPLFKTTKAVVTNRDYRDLPIVSPKEEDESALQKTPEWLGEYFRFILKDMLPIGVTNITRGAEQGSALSWELPLGIRTAPRHLVDPEGVEALKHRIEYQKYYGKRGRGGKLQADERERQRYQGPE